MLLRLGLLFLMLLGAGVLMSRMPGPLHRGSLPPPTADEESLRRRLEGHVRVLAGEIGERNLWRPEALDAAGNYVEAELATAGLAVTGQEYSVGGRTVKNLLAEIPGSSRPREIVLVGAHYDTVPGTPGANDNGSGVAVLLELARLLAETRPDRTLRLVAFVNEEPPFFQTEAMGSRVYARSARHRGEQIVAMLSLETLGFYDERSGSQSFPTPLLRPFYPDRGDFVAFVGNLASRSLLRRTVDAFRRHSPFPAEGLAAPAWIAGVDWSDQWSFWEEGYPALMVTDTALFRYPHYHAPGDTPERLDYLRLARVTTGLAATITTLAQAE